MKKFLIIGLIALVATVAMVAVATQDETIERAEVRNPYELTTILNSNASDAEDRIAALEGGSTVGSVEPGYIIVGSATTAGVDVVVSGDIGIISDGTVSLTAGTLSTNIIIGTTYTNTFVFRTLTSGAIVVESITQDAI